MKLYASIITWGGKVKVTNYIHIVHYHILVYICVCMY